MAALASAYLAVTVFRPSVSGRPTGSAPSAAGPRPSERGNPTASPTAPPTVFAFPVIGPVSYEHTHHDSPATDILSRCGSPVVAVTNAMVLDTTTVDAYDARVNAGATRGGLSVSILGDDGVRYYGSYVHSGSGDPAGDQGQVGQRLGEVGRTGDASACHLHFGISPPCARVGDWWNQRGTLWPWPYLDSWRARAAARSPVGEVTAWQAEHGCPAAPLTDP